MTTGRSGGSASSAPTSCAWKSTLSALAPPGLPRRPTPTPSRIGHPDLTQNIGQILLHYRAAEGTYGLSLAESPANGPRDDEAEGPGSPFG